MHFACHSAGTPARNEYAHLPDEPRCVAPEPLLARLSQRLLGGQAHGALACVGHVDRTWGFSFLGRWGESQLAMFTTALEKLATGYPLGAAFEVFGDRYAQLEMALAGERRRIVERGHQSDPPKVVELWTARNDARGYAIVGDPAVRL